MNWLIAPNAFKGSLEADEASEIIRDLIQRRNENHNIVTAPIADGGDGTCYLLNQHLGLAKHYAVASDPIGRPIKGFYGYESATDSAYLDVSTVSGIKWLKPNELDPWKCSTYGTGELIRKAYDNGAKNIILGLGGSATVDMGTGILAALGVQFLDKHGDKLDLFSSNFLTKIAAIQIKERLPELSFTCLCDVSNPFFGDRGAIPVFGPQKGIKPEAQPMFVEAAKNVYQLFEKAKGSEIQDQACFGAAGGIALGLGAFFPTKMAQGAHFFFEKIEMTQKIAAADVIITGEGRYDNQSADGKGSYELLQLARRQGKKVWLITSGNGAEKAGFDEVIKVADLDFSLPEVPKRAATNLTLSLDNKLEEKGF
ncbi:glycerate 3-kinase [Cyclobacterium sediminis]